MQINKNSVSSVIIDVLACYDETGKSEMQDLFIYNKFIIKKYLFICLCI